MKNLLRILMVILMASGMAASLLVGGASAAGGVSARAELAQAVGCHGGPAFVDTWYEFGAPYSFTTGSTRVSHFQWRIADDNWAEVRTNDPNTSITLHRSDGAVCGPFRVFASGGEYRARTGYLPNTSNSDPKKVYGVWACVSFSSGGQCGAVKWESGESD